MKASMRERLVDQYPELYDSGFEFECEEGWFLLVDGVSNVLSSQFNYRDDVLITVKQVKEKYAELRFSVSVEGAYSRSSDAHPAEFQNLFSSDDTDEELTQESAFVDGITTLVRGLSKGVCERCGSTTNIDQRQVNGRIKTLCDSCLN